MLKFSLTRFWQNARNPIGTSVASALLLLISGVAHATDPSSPGSLQFESYSNTSAEVFWNRATDDGLVVAYEIKVNDEIIGNRDALSYYMNALVAGQSYTVAVTSIDDQGNRSAPASVGFVAGGATGTTPPTSSVATPTGLQASVYSTTSAEIMWNRPATFGLSYEISRNDAVVATTTGVSYYDRDLTPGTSYTYQIVAIDRSGNRSSAATVSLSTSGGTAVIPPGTSLATPTGLQASVYSIRSAEIMWDRPATAGLSYEVSRNGSVVTTTTGVSYFDGNLAPTTTYTYEVVATDPTGNRSSAAAISLSTATGTVTMPASPSVATPTGVQALVYSSRSGEIVWDRPATVGLSYEVSRNGAVLTTTTGVSYYDGNLSPATTYDYQIVAIDQEDDRSAPAHVTLSTPSASVGSGSIISNASALIDEPADLYDRDGYGVPDVIRLDVRTVTTPGVCNADDESGCTLTDVLADIDKTDDHTVDIPIHVSGDDFPDDGTVSNAELRLRGGGSRFAPQKSFRIKLDSKEELWRSERYFQLNKHPFDSSRIRNKLAMDVMSAIPSLPSLRTQFVNLWIDDGAGPEDYGLFTHVERVNGNFLENRQWDDDDNIYKAEDFRFNAEDLSDILVDDEGEPLDEDRFESSLEIENGKDHRALQSMLQDLNNPARTFASVLDQYFDRPNVLAWVATNILVHQADAVRHNFILYNPIGTERFFFVPWDYDEAMRTWIEPPTDLSNDSLRQRSEYGYGLAAGNVFLEGYYRLPGIHDEILEAVDYLRQNIVTDQLMSETVDTYFNLVAPFEQQLPDSEFNLNFSLGSAVRYASAPGQNAEILRNLFRAPIGPILQVPQEQASSWLFSWRPAYDVTGTSGGISYRLQLASTPTFDAGTVLVDVSDIPDSTETVTHRVDSVNLPAGDYYARVFAIPANEPARFFQVSGNKLHADGNTYYGAIAFSVN